jgi:hypothetical protein
VLVLALLEMIDHTATQIIPIAARLSRDSNLCIF